MTLNSIKLAVAACDLANAPSPLIEGSHGIGKTDAVNQYAKENNMHCVELVLSLMDTADLLGMPRSVEQGGQLTTLWAAPQWFNEIIDAAWPMSLHTEDLTFVDDSLRSKVLARIDDRAHISRSTLNDLYCEHYDIPNNQLHLHVQDQITYAKSRRSVLFLDEFNRAHPDILNASLQLILGKRLNAHRLPIVNGKPTLTVAAINPAGNGKYKNVQVMDPALLDRFTKFEAEADVPAWLDWARDKKDLAEVVKDFITEHPQYLFDANMSDPTKVMATPRSWTGLARTCMHLNVIDKGVHFDVMKGMIGSELAGIFLQFYNNYSKVIKMEEVEVLINKKLKSEANPEKIGEAIAKLLKDQEAQQKTEMAEKFYSKYKTSTDVAKITPLLAYLYSMELELLNGFLSKKKTDDSENYLRMAKLDGEANNRGLFRKIASKIKK